MEFALGFLSGLLVATIVFICEILLSKRQKSITSVIEQVFIPKERGSIYIPKDDADEARQEIIRENDKAGKPTHLKDLYED